VRSRPADFHVRPVGLVHARQRILVMAALSVAATHSLILTVSHDLFSRQPLAATVRMPPPRSQSPIVSRQFDARIRAVLLSMTLAIPRRAFRQHSPRRRLCRRSPTLHSARHFVNARKTDETSRSESGDPVCRPIRRLLFPASLFRLSFHEPARPNLWKLGLWKLSSGRSRLRGTNVSGRFRARKLVGSSRYSKCFFAGGAMPRDHDRTPVPQSHLLAMRARGAPARSVRQEAGARPACENNAPTAAA